MRQAVLILLLICFFFGCATTDLPPVTSGAFTVSDFADDEKRLWLRSKEEQEIINGSGLIYEDKDIEDYVNEVAIKLIPDKASEHIPLKIMIIKDPHLNAFAFPNGVIYIHTGMLARMENEAQLATLLAHEMTHCTHRHSTENLRSIKNKTAVFATIQVAVGGLGGGIGDLATLLGTLGTMAAVTGYSRKLETEADTNGFRLMVEAGYDPTEAPKLFIHLKKELEEEDVKEPFFFGTHPKLKERTKNFENLLQTANRRLVGGTKNTEIFLQKTHKVILDNARLDLRLGRFKWAQRGIERYLSLQPDDAKAYYVLGDICSQKGEEDDREKAIGHFRKCISLDSSFPDPHRELGLLYYKQGERALAKRHFEKYLLLSTQAPDRLYIDSYIRQLQ